MRRRRLQLFLQSGVTCLQVLAASDLLRYLQQNTNCTDDYNPTAMAGADDSSQTEDDLIPLGTVQHVSNKLRELSQGLCHHYCIINAALSIITATVIICPMH